MATQYSMESFLSIDAQSGDVEFDTAFNRWTQTSPAIARVVLTMRTVKGSSAVAPTRGVDWLRVQKLAANAAEQAREAVNAALLFLTRDGTISDFKVLTEVEATRNLIRVAVEFLDVRASRRYRYRHRQAV